MAQQRIIPKFDVGPGDRKQWRFGRSLGLKDIYIMYNVAGQYLHVEEKIH